MHVFRPAEAAELAAAPDVCFARAGEPQVRYAHWPQLIPNEVVQITSPGVGGATVHIRHDGKVWKTAGKAPKFLLDRS